MRLADRGYDAGWIRTLVNAQGAFNIPPQRNRREPICFSPPLYRARNCIERFFNKIKHGRRIDTTTGARRRSWLLDLIAIEVEIRKVAPTCVCTLTICGLFFPSLPAQPHPPLRTCRHLPAFDRHGPAGRTGASGGLYEARPRPGSLRLSRPRAPRVSDLCPRAQRHSTFPEILIHSNARYCVARCEDQAGRTRLNHFLQGEDDA